MRRVMVVGCAGAGKTTLARSLAARLALPDNHLRIARLRSDRDAHEFLAMLGRS